MSIQQHPADYCNRSCINLCEKKDACERVLAAVLPWSVSHGSHNRSQKIGQCWWRYWHCLWAVTVDPADRESTKQRAFTTSLLDEPEVICVQCLFYFLLWHNSVYVVGQTTHFDCVDGIFRPDALRLQKAGNEYKNRFLIWSNWDEWFFPDVGQSVMTDT